MAIALMHKTIRYVIKLYRGARRRYVSLVTWLVERGSLDAADKRERVSRELWQYQRRTTRENTKLAPLLRAASALLRYALLL